LALSGNYGYQKLGDGLAVVYAAKNIARIFSAALFF
jgi:hypothetical protein